MTYESGGTARLSLSVDRTAATVRVRIGYSTDYLPFATLRSMFVRENNCDTALVTVNRQGKPVGVYHVLEPFVCIGSEYVFHRDVPSTHNMSAPGIIIRPTDPSTP